MNYHIWWIEKKLSYYRGTARRSKSVEILSNAEQLYKKSHLNQLALWVNDVDLKMTQGGWKWRDSIDHRWLRVHWRNFNLKSGGGEPSSRCTYKSGGSSPHRKVVGLLLATITTTITSSLIIIRPKFGRILLLAYSMGQKHGIQKSYGYNSAESEPIWIKFETLWAKCWRLALTDFGRYPRNSDSLRGSRIFFAW